jgi:hypothetical protein
MEIVALAPPALLIEGNCIYGLHNVQAHTRQQ